MMRGRRAWLLLAMAVLLVGVVAALNGRESGSAPLDPASFELDGARATAQVLRDQGVQLDVVRSADELASAGADPGTTVIVTASDQLGPSTVERLREDAGGAQLLVVDPPDHVTQQWDVQTSTPVRLLDPVAAGCSEAVEADWELAADEALAYPTAQGCFDTGEGYLLAHPEPGVVFLGAGAVLSNDQVLRADNAAIALSLVGENNRVVWYVADPEDLAAADLDAVGAQLPPWLQPALWLAALAVVALMLWRGRRLGPLLTEPMPVVVRALETTESRGRLYHRARDRAHAARALRASATETMARRLHLDPSAAADPARLARDVAAVSGLEPTEVHRLLDPSAPAPTTDSELVTLAGRLAALDREVRTR